TVKNEFHISQTIIRAAGNNPLKFSADDDDALAGLLGIGRDAGMSPEQAIAEAFRDMRLHELAVASAMQQAVRDMLAALAPSRVMFGDPETVMDRALGLHKRAAWDNYRRLHAETMRALNDDFDGVFGRAFARAYEAALAAISAQGGEHEP
ncbi:MAG TPA: type VI secretion system-associated FHA domain protein TagH, partial [Acetobacteraceae bacterium]|nr:type VI secretion system-associated FHA domain protein TagH [Acetobacteraceae bacterium]